METLRNFTATGRRSSILIAILAVGGCTRYEYEIDLTPRGNEIERTLVVTEHHAPPPKQDDNAIHPLHEEALRLEEVYGQPSFQVDDEIRISGRFSDRMPQDLGGAGSYTHWETSLGTATLYIERFRGETNLAHHLKGRLRAAELAVEMLTVFVETEAADSSAGRRLRQFVSTELPRDAEDLTLLIWTLHAEHDELGETTKRRDATVVRLFQFLLERGYLTRDDLPKLIHWNPEFEDQWLRQVLLHKLGLSEDELSRALLRGRPPEEVSAAFNAALIDSDVYRQCLTFLPESDTVDPMSPTGPEQAFTGLLHAIIGSPLLEHDKLTVRLRLPVPPFSTNGERSDDWIVMWSTELAVPGNPSRHALATLCYAAWAEPNESFQRARFGKVLLTGRTLAEYVLWRRMLDDTAGPQWDAFLAALSPDDDLKSRLDAFRYSTTPADVETDPRIEVVKGILLNSDEPECTGYPSR